LKNRIATILIALLLAVAAGCAAASPEPTATATIVPPTDTPTATPIPPTPTATPIPPVVFVLPQMLVESLTISIPPEVGTGAVPTFIGRGEQRREVGQLLPRHIILEFQDYPAIPGSREKPALRIFTVNGMMEIFDFQIEAIRAMLNGETTNLPKIPAFPNLQPAMLQTRMLLPLRFQNGNGFRYINFDPIVEDGRLVDISVSYVYQGITDDDVFFISLILPIDLPELRQQGYASMTQAALNPTPMPVELMLLPLLPQFEAALDTDFIPSLTVLDMMVQSLLVIPE